jgi:hypothetical protein
VLLSEIDKPDWEHMKTWRNSWFHGFNLAIWKRLDAAERGALQEADKATTGTELVILDRSAQVDASVGDIYPKLRKATPIKTSGEGRWSGFDAGNRADIGAGRLGSNSNKALAR